MLGINSHNGFPIPLEFRYPLLKKAGFDSMILGWDNSEIATRVDRVWLSKAFDLKIEHAHGSFKNINSLWIPGAEGDRTCRRLLREIGDCSEFGINTLVLHLTSGSTPPPVSEDGMQRLDYLVRFAEKSGVRLAFENMRVPQHLQTVLEHFNTPYVGLCYDSGHENLWTPNTDWLSLHKDRVFAIHLHDNDGTADTHDLPFSGTVNWEKVTSAIAASGYTGSITLEVEFPGDALHNTESFRAFLCEAYKHGKMLEEKIHPHAKRNCCKMH